MIANQRQKRFQSHAVRQLFDGGKSHKAIIHNQKTDAERKNTKLTLSCHIGWMTSSMLPVNTIMPALCAQNSQRGAQHNFCTQ